MVALLLALLLLLSQLPLLVAFEPNEGQIGPRVAFLARGGGYTLFLTQGGGADAAPRPAPAGGRICDRRARSRVAQCAQIVVNGPFGPAVDTSWAE